MGLITEEVEVGLGGSNALWYEKRGYKIPRILNKYGKLIIPKGAKIIVKVNDLMENSSVGVVYICDSCHKKQTTSYFNYMKCVKKDGTYYCKPCSNILYGGESIRKASLISSISFENWCKKNNHQDFLDRWDYELNVYKPNEISFGTAIKCWFKCPSGLHKSELKSINSLRIEQNIKCSECNYISIGSHITNLFGSNAIDLYWGDKNTINPFNINFGTNQKVWVICKNCGTEKLTQYSHFITYGIACRKCSDGISYPEKFMYAMLEQLEIEFESQLTKSTYEWCGKYRYDFYIPSLNCIIETHGGQHYDKDFVKSSKEIQKNDRDKELLAKQNGVNYYIVIDCSKSELEYIKDNIKKSYISKLVNLNNIDWEKCNSSACNSLVKKACELWNNGTVNTQEIANDMKMARGTIIKYLKRGYKSGWCNYNPDKETSKRHNKMCKKIFCIELKKCFNSMRDAMDTLGINEASISKSCTGRQKTAGGYHWMYYEDYLKLHNNKNKE